MPELSQELIALVHHVQLNETGWWQTAMERLVLATIWQGDGQLFATSLTDDVARLQGVRLEASQVKRQLDRLKSSGAVVSTVDGKLKVTEQRLKQLELDRQSGEEQLARVKHRFMRELKAAGVTDPSGKLWDIFSERWVRPTVCSLGARMYDMIRGGFDADWLSATDLAGFLETVAPESRAAVRHAVTQFLDPSDADVRQYLLRMMDAYFIVEASQLSQSTVEQLARATGRTPTFYLLLDTNVLLSILGLHGEAKEEAARLLLSLAGQLRGRVDIKLYMMPQTIDETRGALQNELAELEALNLSPSVALGALKTDTLGEVATAYAETVAKAGRRITARDFLGPYINNLSTILQDRGIELYNSSAEAVLARREVGEEVERQVLYEQQRYTRPKKRSQIRHDVALWFTVHEKRPAGADAPADAVYWIATEDTRFISFDLHMRKHRGLPVCLQPLGLVQILQFWTGRTERLEQALVGGMQLSVVSPEFPAETEHATNMILGVLSRYENADDLRPELVTKILINDALRQRLTGAESTAEQAELVRDELLTDLRTFQEVASTAQAEREQAERQLAEERARIEEERIAARRAEGERQEERSRLLATVSDLQTFREQTEATTRAGRVTRARRDFTLRVSLLTIAFVGLLVAAFLIPWFHAHPAGRLAFLFVTSCVAPLLLWRVTSRAKQNAHLVGWSWIGRVERGIAAVVAIGVVGVMTGLWSDFFSTQMHEILRGPAPAAAPEAAAPPTSSADGSKATTRAAATKSP